MKTSDIDMRWPVNRVVDLALDALGLDLGESTDEPRTALGYHQRQGLVGQRIHDAHAAVVHP